MNFGSSAARLRMQDLLAPIVHLDERGARVVLRHLFVGLPAR
jgi:hypothetical protein